MKNADATSFGENSNGSSPRTARLVVATAIAAHAKSEARLENDIPEYDCPSVP